MKRNFIKLCAVLVILTMTLSSAASVIIPPEVKTFLLHFYSEFNVAADALINAAESTNDPAALAKALNAYADRIEPLFNRLAELEIKYSAYFEMMEEKEDDESSGDAEVDRAAAEFDKYEEKLPIAMMKVFQHYEHPEVMKVLERLRNIMPPDEDDDDDEDYY